jgi:hypothetical protein
MQSITPKRLPKRPCQTVCYIAVLTGLSLCQSVAGPMITRHGFQLTVASIPTSPDLIICSPSQPSTCAPLTATHSDIPDQLIIGVNLTSKKTFNKTLPTTSRPKPTSTPTIRIKQNKIPSQKKFKAATDKY